MFESLTAQPSDELLALIKQCAADPRSDKLDLGVGVYRDESGTTPVMAAIKSAEQLLFRQQTTKSYLGPEGDMTFVRLLRSIVFGNSNVDDRIAGIQTPGGSGALRVAAELIVRARPSARIWISSPTWPNHRPILGAVGAKIVEYPYFDLATQSLLFDEMALALECADAGDVVLLHGSCHNPTGADLSAHQWDVLIDLMIRRGLLPLIDLAYQGLGNGLDEDAYGARRVASEMPEALVAYSCDKNFALYRERTGVLFALGKTPAACDVIASNMAAVARANWSMPPDHGAAAVRLVLESAELKGEWLAELDTMRNRIAAVRNAVAEKDDALVSIGAQRGLFSNLAVSRETVTTLRNEYGVYMAPSGRINLAGLKVSDAPKLVTALRSVGYLPEPQRAAATAST